MPKKTPNPFRAKGVTNDLRCRRNPSPWGQRCHYRPWAMLWATK